MPGLCSPEMNVLVTGGGGFIGSHLAARLASLGHRVRILDNFATGRRSNVVALDGDIELVEGDVQSYERVHNAIAGCEVVFHQAALPSVPRSVADPLTSNATNVTGTLNVLLAARDAGVRRVVFASSSSVYGATRGAAQARGHGRAPDLALRRGQARVRGLLPQLRRGLRPGDRGAALLQRLRPAPGPALAVRRGGPELHHRPAHRTSARRSSATASSRGTSPTSRTSSRRTCSRWTRTSLRAASTTWPAARRSRSTSWLAELRELVDSDIEPVYAAPRAGDVPPLAGRPDAIATRPGLRAVGRPSRGVAPLDRAPQGPLALG